MTASSCSELSPPIRFRSPDARPIMAAGRARLCRCAHLPTKWQAPCCVGLANLVGIGLLLLAFFLYQRTEAFVTRAWPAPGMVVGFERGDGDEPRPAPVVRFETPRGEEHRFRADLYVAWRDYGMGETVPVLYDPRQPADARVDDSLLLWIGPLIAAAFGLILTLGSTGALAVTLLSVREARTAGPPPLEIGPIMRLQKVVPIRQSFPDRRLPRCRPGCSRRARGCQLDARRSRRSAHRDRRGVARHSEHRRNHESGRRFLAEPRLQAVPHPGDGQPRRGHGAGPSRCAGALWHHRAGPWARKSSAHLTSSRSAGRRKESTSRWIARRTSRTA